MSEAIERRLRGLAEELAAAVTDVAGTPVAMTPGVSSRQDGWRITMTATGDPAGKLVALLDSGATVHLATRVLRDAAANGDGGDEETTGLLREVLSRAAAAMATRGPDERLTLVVEGVERVAAHEAGGADAVAFGFTLEGLDDAIPVALTWTHVRGATASNGRGPASNAAAGGRLDVILDIELPVIVRFGHTQMPIRALSRLGPGSVIELGRSPDDPVEVLVSNRVVARGEVVIVGGNYGVRILDVTSQSERARSMEG